MTMRFACTGYDLKRISEMAQFLLAVVAVLILVFAGCNAYDSLDKRNGNIATTVGRLTAEAAVGAAPTVVGKAAIRATSIRYATKAVGAVARGVLPSKTWRAMAVYGGTRLSNIVCSSWMPFVSAGLFAYDAYQLANLLLSDD